MNHGDHWDSQSDYERLMMTTITTIITRPTTHGKNETIPVPTLITTCLIVSPEET